ncbi:MAG: hypothetical protein V3U96_01920 [Paracoccaceae bacterium]
MTIKGVLLALPLIIFGWITIMALVMRFSDAAPAAVVLFPSAEFVAALPKGTAIIAANAVSVTLRADISDFGESLYQAGALLVLPAGLTGCLPLPKQSHPQP